MQTALATQETQSFWDRIAPKYARKPVADLPAYEQKLSRLRELLQPSDRVLEIGCGTGSTALRLAPDVAHVTATDVSRGMIGIAQAKLGESAPANVQFRRAGASDKVDGQPFDAICAFSLLHLVQDMPQVLKSAREQLQPGGLFISKTVCLKNASIFIRAFVAILTAIGLAPRVTALGAGDITRSLRDAGFEIEETSYFGANRMNPFIVARRPVA